MELKRAIACRECHQWVKHTEWALFDLNCLNHLEFSAQLIAIVLNVLRNTQFLVSRHSNSTICNAADDDIIIINAMINTSHRIASECWKESICKMGKITGIKVLENALRICCHMEYTSIVKKIVCFYLIFFLF